MTNFQIGNFRDKLLSLLVLSVLVSLFLINPSLLAMGSEPAMVQVTARIQPAQIIETGWSDLDSSREKLVAPVSFGSEAELTGETLKKTVSLTLDLGSNKPWALWVNQGNLEEINEKLRSAGWWLESVLLACRGKQREIEKKSVQIASGQNGSFKVKISCQFILEKLTNRSPVDSDLDQIRSLLVFRIS